jgi:hypothetical protein
MNNTSDKPENSEKPEDIIDEIVSSLDNLHEKTVEDAANIGYARDVMKSIRPLWEQLGNSTTSDPDTVDLYESNLGILHSFRDQITAYQELAMPLAGLSKNAAGTASFLISASSTTATFFVSTTEFSSSDFPVFLSPDRHEKYKKRFMAFDVSLGNIYQEIWEVLYGTRGDPERGALYLLRQSFDHLFDKLAPDDEVRRSLFWKLKVGNKPQEIWRNERIQFAAATRIKDKAIARTVLASSKHILAVYQSLNAAHERKEINRAKARKALEEMRSYLEEWADAIGL